MSVRVKISAKSMQLLFTLCTEQQIRNVCHGSCCNTRSKPTCLVTILPEEKKAVENYGVKVKNNLIVPLKGERDCPLKSTDGFCRLHNTGHKPFGCIVSPFKLNSKNTLMVMNRYKLMKCYKTGNTPAYVAFFPSLITLFGEKQALDIKKRLIKDPYSDFYAEMLSSAYDNLHLKYEVLTNAIEGLR